MSSVPTKGSAAVHHGSHTGLENPMHPVAANIAALRARLGEIDGDFTRVISTQLPQLHNALKSKGVEALTVPPLAGFSGGEPGSGGVAGSGRDDSGAGRVVSLGGR